MQHSKSRPINNAAPTTEPITIPAIAPFDRPEPCWLLMPAAPLLADAGGVLVDVDVDDDVDDGKRGGIDVKDGSVTPEHLLFTLAPSQQESVAFGELEAQKPQRP